MTLYVLALVGLRARLRLGSLRPRTALAVLTMPTILIGTHISALAQLSTLAILLVATNTFERKRRRSVSATEDRQAL